MIYLTAAISYLAFISITGIRVSNNTTEESSTEFVSKDITNTDNISGGRFENTGYLNFIC